jgi:hypothetical protein
MVQPVGPDHFALHDLCALLREVSMLFPLTIPEDPQQLDTLRKTACPVVRTNHCGAPFMSETDIAILQPIRPSHRR